MEATITATDANTLNLPSGKKKYPRNYAADNAADAVEKHRLRELLRDICTVVKEPEHKGRGRKPHSYRDAIFSMAMKVYIEKSSRKSNCDLLDAHNLGYLSKPIPGMKVCQFFENPVFTPILSALLSYTATPLKSVETCFAIDSTGFSSYKYESWFDIKKEIEKDKNDKNDIKISDRPRKHVWCKAHAAIGVNTHIVTAVRILDKDAPDCPQYPDLLKATNRAFVVDEVYADKAYLSGDNVNETHMIDAIPYILPKSNSTGGIGGLFRDMINYFKYKEEDFRKHYHQRSNIETAFSMVKKAVGAYVRSKTDVAMKNEVLCKFLCHNLCVLNQEQYELGIIPELWGDRAEPAKA
jgi:hypothetical protein